LAIAGVGVATALVTRRVRDGRRPEPPRRPKSRLQRRTLAQIDLAIALLEGRGEVEPERTVHETRKALKRARALVRLQRDGIGRKRFRRENAALRDAGKLLALARDAEVSVDALDALVRAHPKRLAGSPAVRELRARLLAERERAWTQTAPGAQAREAALAQLRASRLRVECWKPARSDRRGAREGLRRIYAQGRGRRRTARRAQSSEALHEWRKRVKDLRYAAEMLRLRGLARRADRLGETIGAEHDLTLLAERLRVHRDCFASEKATRKALNRAIERRRERLRRRALRLGKGLYRRRPKRFVRDLLET
jgi:hypothetical protein